MSRRLAIVQARMGSGRLPGKVLADIAGVTMLGRVLERLQRCRTLDAVVVATPHGRADDVLTAVAARYEVGVVRGPVDDVLTRYVEAARTWRGDVIVRVTADCPLIDPAVVDDVVDALDAGVDYASNTHVRTFPRGLDVEALHRDTLERLARLAVTPATREHVTSLVLEQPGLFRVAQVTAATPAEDLRWTVDTPEDLAVVRRLYAELDLGAQARPYADVVRHVRAHPALAAGNAQIAQKHWSIADVA